MSKLNIIYCGIIKVRGGSIFVVFVGSPPPRIYTLNESKFTKRYIYYWNWKPRRRILEIKSPWIRKNPQSTNIYPHGFRWFHIKQNLQECTIISLPGRLTTGNFLFVLDNGHISPNLLIVSLHMLLSWLILM